MELTLIVTDAIRAAIGLVFIYSAAEKLRDIGGFVRGVREYRVLPVGLATVYAALVVPAESVVGLSFVTGQLVRLTAPLAVLLLATFFVAVAIALWRRTETPCHCFGSESSERLSARTLVRLGLLCVGAVLVLARQLSDASPAWSAIGEPSALPTVIINVAIGLFVIAAAQWVSALPRLIRLPRRGVN